MFSRMRSSEQRIYFILDCSCVCHNTVRHLRCKGGIQCEQRSSWTRWRKTPPGCAWVLDLNRIADLDVLNRCLQEQKHSNSVQHGADWTTSTSHWKYSREQFCSLRHRTCDCFIRRTSVNWDQKEFDASSFRTVKNKSKRFDGHAPVTIFYFFIKYFEN